MSKCQEFFRLNRANRPVCAVGEQMRSEVLDRNHERVRT